MQEAICYPEKSYFCKIYFCYTCFGCVRFAKTVPWNAVQALDSKSCEVAKGKFEHRQAACLAYPQMDYNSLCRGWRDCIRLRQQTLQPKLLHHLLATSFPNVQSLDLRKCKYQPDQLAVLTQLNGLNFLALQLCSTQDAVDQLSELPGTSLTSLELSGCPPRPLFPPSGTRNLLIYHY